MSLQNIKAGDVVLAPVSITYGFNQSINYLVRRKVDRVTNTQIIIKDTKYKKESGAVVGGSSFEKIYDLSQIGTKISTYGNNIIEDQTEDYKADVLKVNQLNALRKQFEAFQKLVGNEFPKLLKTVELPELEVLTQNMLALNEKVTKS